MTQRSIAALIAAPLVLALFLVTSLVRLPFGTYAPGTTVDVLAQPEGNETIQVRGAKTYRDTGQLRMTTVSVSAAAPPGQTGGSSLFTLLRAWADPEDAVYPYDFIHPDDESAEEDQQQGAISMVTSQDVATAVALEKLGYDVERAVKVYFVDEGTPADGVLEPLDIIRSVGGEPVRTPRQLVAAVSGAEAGEPLAVVIERDGRRREVSITPEEVEGQPRIGVVPGEGYRFPFEVSVAIDPKIGGPSAGLVFSLGIYDTLTEGSLTGGEVIAGTGTVALDGSVGPIGGIQQKIAGAADDGATLFLVPPDNCEEALGADVDGIRLLRADTFDSTLAAIQDWVEDPDAALPSCEDVPDDA